MMKYGDPVVILCQKVDGAYYDVVGVYQKVISRGSHKGQIEVKFNGCLLHITPERLAPVRQYFEAFNGDRKTLPAGSTGRMWFLDYVESEGSRGNLLNDILKKEDGEG